MVEQTESEEQRQNVEENECETILLCVKNFSTTFFLFSYLLNYP